MGFLSNEELLNLGFNRLGNNVLISKKASLYNTKNISIGSNVRIDDFSILSAGEEGIEIGNYVHIACYVSFIGKAKIVLEDYVGISSKTSVYSSSDDYTGNFMTNPTISDEFKSVDNRPVIFKKYSIIGAGSIILPGVIVGEGTAVGALSLVTKKLPEWSVYMGSPVRFIKERKKEMLRFLPQLEKLLHEK
jgi:acetyltransferase-like isoleucine patch superfamily enzyme|nr:acyltransferase [uncultured Flavobacterium sp.]